MTEQQPSSAPNPKISSEPQQPAVKRENTLLNIGFNILLPILVLNKGKGLLGPYLEPHFENIAVPILLIALLFPVGYFVYDYFKRSKYNLFSILGLVSVLMTGGIGILEIPTQWFAVKEAAIPLLLGIAVLVSLKTHYPLIRTLLYNPEMIDVEKVQAQLEVHNSQAQFDQLLTRCTWLLAASFLISATLNFVLARWIVVSPSGTEAFNAEVSKMMLWSWPVIAIPSMLIMMFALLRLLKGIKQMTGLTLEEVMHGASDAKQ